MSGEGCAWARRGRACGRAPRVGERRARASGARRNPTCRTHRASGGARRVAGRKQSRARARRIRAAVSPRRRGDRRSRRPNARRRWDAQQRGRRGDRGGGRWRGSVGLYVGALRLGGGESFYEERGGAQSPCGPKLKPAHLARGLDRHGFGDAVEMPVRDEADHGHHAAGERGSRAVGVHVTTPGLRLAGRCGGRLGWGAASFHGG